MFWFTFHTVVLVNVVCRPFISEKKHVQCLPSTNQQTKLAAGKLTGVCGDQNRTKRRVDNPNHLQKKYNIPLCLLDVLRGNLVFTT